ncbi:hypothetical protein YC2023_114929 [Brassica napus]
MGSRSDSEEQFTLDTNYVPPDTTDFETQQVMARLAAIDENDDQRDGGDEGNKQGRKRKLISPVDSEEDVDVEITPTTQPRKPPRKTSFGTASQKPMYQSTLDGGSGSSAQANSQKKTVPLKSVIRGGRRKPAPRRSSTQSRKNKGPSTQSRKNKGPSTQSLKRKSKIQEEIQDFDEELVEDELDEDEAGRWSDAAWLLSHFIKREISPNVITSTALVDAFVKNGKVLEAKELYEEMIRMSIDPDIFIYSSLINGLCMQDHVDEASEMFGLMVKRGCSPDVVSYNTLINWFCKAKRVEDGMRLVREMSERGLVSSGGPCDNGEVEKALVMFEDLQKSEMEVDIVTYTTIIHGMCKAGKVEDAWGLFCSLSVKVVKPDVVAYRDGLVLNDGKLCLRDGDITVSADVIKELLTRATSEGCEKAVVMKSVALLGVFYLVRVERFSIASSSDGE